MRSLVRHRVRAWGPRPGIAQRESRCNWSSARSALRCRRSARGSPQPSRPIQLRPQSSTGWPVERTPRRRVDPRRRPARSRAPATWLRPSPRRSSLRTPGSQSHIASSRWCPMQSMSTARCAPACSQSRAAYRMARERERSRHERDWRRKAQRARRSPAWLPGWRGPSHW